MWIELQDRNRAEPVEIWKARKFIDENSDEGISLKRVAAPLNISGSYLSEKFKRVTGINFVDYVARIRVRKTQYLLENSDRRISEIAFAVGFQSLSQFNRVFRKLIGKSPSAYRNDRGAHGIANGEIPPGSVENIFRKNA